MFQRFLLPFIPLLLAAQTIPTRLGGPINLIPPAISADARTVIFAAAMAPDATPQKVTNLYVASPAPAAIRQLTDFKSSIDFEGVTSISYSAGLSAYTVALNGPAGDEEVHLIDIAKATDRTLFTDLVGCIQPLCVSCARSCVGPVHLADGGKVLYAVARQQPFFVINADGTGPTHLPVYQGALAPSPQRAISRGGVLVFTSSAPSGPTFVAAATEVYAINLDGTGLRQITKFGKPEFYASTATISADGVWIAFASNYSTSGAQQESQAWMVRSDGTGLRQLSAGQDSASSISISADGSVVTFVQGGQIQSVNTTAAAAKPLALTSLTMSVPRDAVVSDDGAHVVFTIGPINGASAAIYRIVADAPSDTRSFVSIFAPRLLNVNGVGSAAGVGAPSPGSLLTAYGANLGIDELVQATTFPLPVSLGGLSLLVNGKPVPLLAVTPWQINAQVPQNVAAGTAAFQVRDAGGALQSIDASVESVAPVNFSYPFVRGNLYYSQAAAFHAGTGVPADMDHPVSAGETIEIYGLGLGVTEPVVEAGLPSPSSPPARAVQTPRVQLGGRDAAVTFAGLAPGYAGVYQVNVVVPSGLSPGIQNLAWRGSSGATSYSSVAVK